MADQRRLQLTRRSALVLLASALLPGQDEVPAGIRRAFQKSDARLTQFEVVRTPAIHGAWTAMLAQASAPGQAGVYQIGLFVVDAAGALRLVVAADLGRNCCAPRLGRPTDDALYVDWYGDYGRYAATSKYIVDIARGRSGPQYTYRRFDVDNALMRDGKPVFTGKYESPARVELDGASGALALEAPAWSLRSVSAQPPAVARRRFRISPGQTLSVLPPAESAPVGSIGVRLHDNRGKGGTFRVPKTTASEYKRFRTDASELPPDGIESSIGPFAFDGKHLWFANDFYDSEGISGVGAIGSFDVASRKYTMRYLPEIASWSGSAMLLDGNDLWIGLMRRPEGQPYGGGVLRYNTVTGQLREYPITDYVKLMLRGGSLVYFATNHGVYTIDPETNAIEHIRVEPGSRGDPQVVRTPLK